MKLVLRGILVIAAVSLVAEVMLRQAVTGPSNQVFDPEIGYRYEPGSEIFDGAEGLARNQVSSLGLNSAELDPTKAHRALVLGDSYTEARQVERRSNFVSVAAAALPDWDVINGGRDGLNIVSTCVVAERLSALARIDRIVLVTSNADYVDDLLDPGVFVTRQPGGATDIRMAVESREQLKRAFESVVRHSALAVQLIRQFKPVILDTQQALLSWRSPARPAIAAPVDAAGAEPAREATRAERLRLVIERLRRVAPVSLVYVHQLEFRSAREAVPGAVPAKTARALRTVLEPMGVPLRDTGPALAESYRLTGAAPFGFPLTQPGVGHLNVQGHKVVGRAVAELLGAAPTNSAP